MSWKEQIPKIYHSEYSGEPFRTCLVCEGSLEDFDAYMVEKVIRNGEAVLEMALCDSCSDGMVKHYSKESLERELQTFERWMGGDDPYVTENCLGCRKPRDHAGGFVVAAEFMDGFLPVQEVSICETCTEALEAQRSRETRESFGRFVEDYFPGVPHFVDLPVVFA